MSLLLKILLTTSAISVGVLAAERNSCEELFDPFSIIPNLSRPYSKTVLNIDRTVNVPVVSRPEIQSIGYFQHEIELNKRQISKETLVSYVDLRAGALMFIRQTDGHEPKSYLYNLGFILNDYFRDGRLDIEILKTSVESFDKEYVQIRIVFSDREDSRALPHYVILRIDQKGNFYHLVGHEAGEHPYYNSIEAALQLTDQRGLLGFDPVTGNYYRQAQRKGPYLPGTPIVVEEVKLKRERPLEVEVVRELTLALYTRSAYILGVENGHIVVFDRSAHRVVWFELANKP